MFFAALTSALSVYAQATQRKRAWLLRLSGARCPHAEQRWLVNAGLTFSTLPGALSSRRRASRPQPERLIPRFRAALAATLRPGALMAASSVPGPSTGAGIAANAICHLPARSRVTRNDFAFPGTARDQRNRTHPALGILTSPQRRLSLRTSRCVRWTIRNPSSRPA